MPLPPAAATPTNFSELVDFILGFIDTFIALIFLLAFLVVAWKVIDAWIIHADDENKREEGRAVAMTAVIVMAVMASIWGILALLQAAFAG